MTNERQGGGAATERPCNQAPRTILWSCELELDVRSKREAESGEIGRLDLATLVVAGIGGEELGLINLFGTSRDEKSGSREAYRGLVVTVAYLAAPPIWRRLDSLEHLGHDLSTMVTNMLRRHPREDHILVSIHG
jgi:hypothetical protein